MRIPLLYRKQKGRNSIPKWKPPLCLICMNLDLERDDRDPLVVDVHQPAKNGCAGCSVLDTILMPYKSRLREDSTVRINQPDGCNLRLHLYASDLGNRGHVYLEAFTSDSILP